MSRCLATPHRHRRRAIVAVFVIVTMAVLIGFGALAVDVGHMYNTRAQLQDAADAAAHAGAGLLPNAGAARVATHKFARINFPDSGTVLAEVDLDVGNWDVELGVFAPNGLPFNAVRVTTRRSQANGNPLGLFFASIFGIHQTNVSASATALSSPIVCVPRSRQCRSVATTRRNRSARSEE